MVKSAINHGNWIQVMKAGRRVIPSTKDLYSSFLNLSDLL